MNRVAVNAEEIPLPHWSGAMAEYALKVLDEINRDKWELSFLLCGDKTITSLNSRYRGKAEATDILSFSLGEKVRDDNEEYYLPGDIVISLDTLRENAKYYQENEDEELRRLIIHGILHLDGMDHETTDSNEPMLALQEDILNRLKEEIIFTEN
ncbi:MAG: rRNA maturation RNase YbeY [Treponema sp.]|jgi:probable rRNA maturation factor|nr:rRNA maturation RNase YbeY [Treponema sp.]